MTPREFCNLVYARIIAGMTTEERREFDADLYSTESASQTQAAFLAAIYSAPDKEDP